MGSPFPRSAIRVEQILIYIKIYSRSKMNISCELNMFQFGFSSRPKILRYRKEFIMDLKRQLGLEVEMVCIGVKRYRGGFFYDSFHKRYSYFNKNLLPTGVLIES